MIILNIIGCIGNEKAGSGESDGLIVELNVSLLDLSYDSSPPFTSSLSLIPSSSWAL